MLAHSPRVADEHTSQAHLGPMARIGQGCHPRAVERGRVSAPSSFEPDDELRAARVLRDGREHSSEQFTRIGRRPPRQVIAGHRETLASERPRFEEQPQLPADGRPERESELRFAGGYVISSDGAVVAICAGHAGRVADADRPRHEFGPEWSISTRSFGRGGADLLGWKYVPHSVQI